MAQYLTVWRVSQETGHLPGTVRRWINIGIHGVKLKSHTAPNGKTIMIDRKDLDEFLKWREEGVIDIKEDKKRK